MLNRRTCFQPATAWSGALQVHLGDRHYRVRIAARHAEVTAGDNPGDGTTIHTDPDTFVALLTGKVTVADVRIDGDAGLVERVIAGTAVPGAIRSNI